MREEITADWAKKTATNVLNAKIQDQINKVLNDIEIAVKNNRFESTIYSDLHELTVKDIQGRGFKIEKNGNYNQQDGTSYSISWK